MKAGGREIISSIIVQFKFNCKFVTTSPADFSYYSKHDSFLAIHLIYYRLHLYLFENGNLQALKKIFLYKLTGLNFLIVILLIASSFCFLFVVPLLFLLTSNLFDILGYHFTLIRRTTKMPEKEIIKAYRINQLMFDALLFVILGLLFGWIPALCGVLLKIFGVQDVAYYLFLQKELPGKWHWLGFTPLGAMKKNLTKKEVLAQAITGVVICAVILFFYYNYLK
jgi:hypothetical protein